MDPSNSNSSPTYSSTNTSNNQQDLSNTDRDSNQDNDQQDLPMEERSENVDSGLNTQENIENQNNANLNLETNITEPANENSSPNPDQNTGNNNRATEIRQEIGNLADFLDIEIDEEEDPFHFTRTIQSILRSLRDASNLGDEELVESAAASVSMIREFANSIRDQFQSVETDTLSIEYETPDQESNNTDPNIFRIPLPETEPVEEDPLNYEDNLDVLYDNDVDLILDADPRRTMIVDVIYTSHFHIFPHMSAYMLLEDEDLIHIIKQSHIHNYYSSYPEERGIINALRNNHFNPLQNESRYPRYLCTLSYLDEFHNDITSEHPKKSTLEDLIKNQRCIGTICKILKYRTEDDCCFRCLVVGVARCMITSLVSRGSFYYIGRARLIPEVEPPLLSCITLSHEVLSLALSVTYPNYIRSQFSRKEIYSLAQKVYERNHPNSQLTPYSLPISLSALCSYILINIPLSFSYYSAIYKEPSLLLRAKEIVHLTSFDHNFMCSECDTVIMNAADILSSLRISKDLSNEEKDFYIYKQFEIIKTGPIQFFTNPSLVMYTVITVSKVQNCSFWKKEVSEQDSWYPGYVWRIINCSKCKKHIGWCYYAKPHMKKHYIHKFYGISLDAIKYNE